MLEDRSGSPFKNMNHYEYTACIEDVLPELIPSRRSVWNKVIPCSVNWTFRSHLQAREQMMCYSESHIYVDGSVIGLNKQKNFMIYILT
jgi:hypothetical protein